MRLRILNVRHLIVGQMGMKIITSKTRMRNQILCGLNQDGRASSSANKISLTNLPILLLMLSMLQKKKVNHKVVLKTKIGEGIRLIDFEFSD